MDTHLQRKNSSLRYMIKRVCLTTKRLNASSVRDHRVEEIKNDNDDFETKDAGKEDVPHRKSPSHDSSKSTTSANFGCSHGQENKKTKKGIKGGSFIRVISKRRPVCVKNLLKVKSCYHVGCSRNDSKASPLA